MAVNPDFKAHEITEDPIVNEVITMIVKRHMQGMTKFGKTMADSERPFDEWVDETIEELLDAIHYFCLLYTSPSPRDRTRSRMPSSA